MRPLGAGDFWRDIISTEGLDATVFWLYFAIVGYRMGIDSPRL